MKTVMFVIGVILFIVAIAAGFYVGFWVMFVGGIMDIINAIKAPVTEASAIGWGVLKMIFASGVGAITFWIGAAISSIFFVGAGK